MTAGPVEQRPKAMSSVCRPVRSKKSGGAGEYVQSDLDPIRDEPAFKQLIGDLVIGD